MYYISHLLIVVLRVEHSVDDDDDDAARYETQLKAHNSCVYCDKMALHNVQSRRGTAIQYTAGASSASAQHRRFPCAAHADTLSSD
eukprot:1755088-Pleurochrysis_carterae.AAC.2